MDACSIVNKLRSVADSGVTLCRRSSRLVEAADDSTAEAFISAWRDRPVVNPPFVTCIAVLHLQAPAAAGLAGAAPSQPVPSTVVVGTEASGVCILSNTTFKVEKEWQMENVPSMMCTHGVAVLDLQFIDIQCTALCRKYRCLGAGTGTQTSSWSIGPLFTHAVTSDVALDLCAERQCWRTPVLSHNRRSGCFLKLACENPNRN